jgi:DNA (cytosine-5)-methyltransferase 1
MTTSFISNIISTVKEDDNLELSLLNDYKNHEDIKVSELVFPEIKDYLINLVRNSISKVRIVDSSIYLKDHEQEILSFFKKKICNGITRQINKPSFEFYDLFCGAGGLSSGLEKSNFTPKMAIDRDKSSLLTYHFNRPYLKNNQVIHADIEDIVKNFDFNKIPLIVGGPPCQGFSNANKQRKENDARNQLYKFYVQAVIPFRVID